jgi:hypothetical protein
MVLVFDQHTLFVCFKLRVDLTRHSFYIENTQIFSILQGYFIYPKLIWNVFDRKMSTEKLSFMEILVNKL